MPRIPPGIFPASIAAATVAKARSSMLSKEIILFKPPNERGGPRPPAATVPLAAHSRPDEPAMAPAYYRQQSSGDDAQPPERQRSNAWYSYAAAQKGST